MPTITREAPIHVSFDGRRYEGARGKRLRVTRDRETAIRLFGLAAVSNAESDHEAHENMIISGGRYL